MSERRFVDPMTSSFREERVLINFGKKLLSGNEQGANGVFYRLGVITYARTLIEGRLLPSDLEREYDAVLSNDKEYLKDLLNKRISTDRDLLVKAYSAPVPTPQLDSSPQINWLKVPEDQKLATYVQILMEADFRAFWISKYNTLEEEEDRFEILTQFADDILCRHQANQDKPPLKIKDKNEIRNVLRMWADAVRGVES